MNIIWEEPPARVSGRQASRERRETIAQLRQHPGQWAKVLEGAASHSAAAPWRKDGCEARAHRRDDEKIDVYARWPEQDLAEVDPYIARRRARGVPEDGRAASRPSSPGIRAVS